MPIVPEEIHREAGKFQTHLLKGVTNNAHKSRIQIQILVTCECKSVSLSFLKSQDDVNRYENKIIEKSRIHVI